MFIEFAFSLTESILDVTSSLNSETIMAIFKINAPWRILRVLFHQSKEYRFVVLIFLLYLQIMQYRFQHPSFSQIVVTGVSPAIWARYTDISV